MAAAMPQVLVKKAQFYHAVAAFFAIGL